MSAPYNLTYINQGNVTGLMQGINELTDWVFGWWILLLIFVVIFLALKDYPTNRAFGAAAFVTGVFSMVFFVFGIISGFTLFVCVIMAVLGLVWLTVSLD